MSVTANPRPTKASSIDKVRARARISRYVGYANPENPSSLPSRVACRLTSPRPSTPGTGRSTSVFTTPKKPVLTPTANASVTTTETLNPG